MFMVVSQTCGGKYCQIAASSFVSSPPTATVLFRLRQNTVKEDSMFMTSCMLSSLSDFHMKEFCSFTFYKFHEKLSATCLYFVGIRCLAIQFTCFDRNGCQHTQILMQTDCSLQLFITEKPKDLDNNPSVSPSLLLHFAPRLD